MVALQETRCSGNTARKTIKSLGFKHHIVAEARGFSGGIWLMWNRSDIQVQLIKNNFHFLHVQVVEKDVDPWILTVVYASPRDNERNDTWQKLRNIADTINIPWLMIGDFNEIAKLDEKKGGAPTDIRKCHNFNNWINDCKLIEVTTVGTRFTWRGPKWNGRDRVFKKLDRVLCNVAWRLRYHEGFAKVLPRIHSDHHPIITLFQGNPNVGGKRPFRFEAAWVTHEKFHIFLKDKWNGGSDLVNRLHDLTPQLKEWNIEIFGNIFKRKKDLLARLNGIQNSPNYGYSNFLDTLERELQEQLASTLFQEECLWFQKSRGQWIADGDRNTKYYHSKTIIRRRRNKIITLRNENGVWIDDPDNLKNMVRNFYINLFQEDEPIREPIISWATYPMNMEGHHNTLSAPVLLTECKRALFDMGPHKAPGEDGYPAMFFQHCWDTIADSLYQYVNQVWVNPSLISSINNTLIVMIPKVDRPELVTQFRPIALCNVIYKIITKVIVNRIKPLLNDIISPYQSSFIPGRTIHHNIIVAQEMMHAMAKMKGKKMFMSIKIDLEKAYDRLNWNFVENCLSEYQVEAEYWKPMRAEASIEQAHCVMHCLDLFCKASGQKINNQKTEVFFSKNVDHQLREDILNHTGFTQVNTVGTYLGASIAPGRTTRGKFNHIIGKIQNRLSGWKQHCLSFAGRLTLSKSVLSSIPYYHMQYAKLPKTLCDELEKIQRGFLWGDTDQVRKPHLVSWNVCCLPKKEGGLGIKSPHQMNEAFLMKMLWNLITRPDDLWCKVLYSKYGRNKNLCTTISSLSYDSPLWKALTSIWDKFQQNVVWNLGNGNHINFWLDKWTLSGDSLINTTNQPVIDTTLSVRDVLNPAGDWNRSFLNDNLPVNITNQILAIPAPTDLDGPDTIGWGGTTTRHFTVQSAYKLQRGHYQPLEGEWKALWSWKGPHRIQTFIWMAAHERLLTNYRRSKWGVGISPLCNSCGIEEETIIHVLRDCQNATQGLDLQEYHQPF
ncbi:hypothetical protein P8452_13067 [Trifolium repens]|nr:hypothetical protein P8452_13067 [Trifolium repens]